MKKPVNEPRPFHPEKPCSRQVCLKDHPFFVNGKISEGRKVVKIGVVITGDGEILLCPAQLFVLHLQFDPVDLQFVDKTPEVRTGRTGGSIGIVRFGLPFLCPAVEILGNP